MHRKAERRHFGQVQPALRADVPEPGALERLLHLRMQLLRRPRPALEVLDVVRRVRDRAGEAAAAVAAVGGHERRMSWLVSAAAVVV